MGNANNKANRYAEAEQRIRISWAMPSWCIPDFEVTSETIELATASWKYAMSGEAPPFLAAKAKEPSLTPLVFFYNQFYYFLFELVPEVRGLFTKGMKAQGRMLANVIKYVVTSLSGSDETVLRHSLQHLARIHNQKAITAEHYSTMGMVLVHTVRICTGPLYFTHRHSDAWVQIYSKMMSIIIPEVVKNSMPADGETNDMTKVAEQLYKKGNLNAEADNPSTKKTSGNGSPHDSRSRSDRVTTFSGANAATTVANEKTTTTTTTTTQSSPSPILAAGGQCPASSLTGTGEEDLTVSDELAKHLQENATTHLSNLGAASGQGKYVVLTRVIAIAQRVEAHLTEEAGDQPNPHHSNHHHHPSASDASSTSLPRGSVTGAGLVQLLQEKNWVNSVVGCKVACEYFLQFQLMKAVVVDHAATVAADGHTSFRDDATVYTFLLSNTPTASTRPTPQQSHHTTPRAGDPIPGGTFEPHNYVRGFIPTESILHALSPQNMPGMPEIVE